MPIGRESRLKHATAQAMRLDYIGEPRASSLVLYGLMSFRAPKNKNALPIGRAFLVINAGDHLISHTVTRAVPSAQRGLTSVFGMGTGDPSQYGHRQAWYGAWRVGLPAACRGVCSSRMVYPGPGRNADCNLAPQNFAQP